MVNAALIADSVRDEAFRRRPAPAFVIERPVNVATPADVATIVSPVIDVPSSNEIVMVSGAVKRTSFASSISTATENGWPATTAAGCVENRMPVARGTSVPPSPPHAAAQIAIVANAKRAGASLRNAIADRRISDV